MKYVNNQLVTKDNIIPSLAIDNELGTFRFKDYEEIIEEGNYVDIESENEKEDTQ